MKYNEFILFCILLSCYLNLSGDQDVRNLFVFKRIYPKALFSLVKTYNYSPVYLWIYLVSSNSTQYLEPITKAVESNPKNIVNVFNKSCYWSNIILSFSSVYKIAACIILIWNSCKLNTF